MPDIAKLLWPKSVAVIGASSDTHNLRGRIFEIMRGHPFAGNIYPVSRSETVVQGATAYPSIADLPDTPDLAVLIIPAQFVAEELERCGQAGVRAAVILSSGFAEEAGSAGARMQDDIRKIAERYDMAVIGPNAEGFANTATALCPTFSPAIEASARPLLPLPERTRGQIAVIAQSGGMGFAFFDRGRPKELAFRYIVTTGNEACLETLDFVDWMLDEGKTDVFLLLLEDIKTPATFRRVAEKALRAGKPIIVSKIGQSDAGRRAAASHTGALAGAYAADRAMFGHYGVVEGRDLDEMIDMAAAFLAFGARLPKGRRVGICTSSGGGGGWLADASAAAGLDIPELDAETRASIDVHLPPFGTSQNPVDGTAQVINRIGYAELARLVAQSPRVDGVMVVVTARQPRYLQREQERLRTVARETGKPILMWSYTHPAEACVALLSEAGYPLFTNVHNCARAMRAMADYRETRERFLSRPLRATEQVAQCEEVRNALSSAGRILCEWEARPLLAAYGIGAKRTGILARSAAEAEAAARTMAGPVALKVQSPDLPHKTEAGALALNVSAADAPQAYERVLCAARAHAPQAQILGVLVQPMAPAGVEMIVGVKRDPHWGPLLLVGLGGVLVEVMDDVALSPVPVAKAEAHALLRRLKAVRFLDGHRGEPPGDVHALAEAIVRLSQFASDHGEIVSEVDLNPVLVHPRGQGVSIVDALIVTATESGRAHDRQTA